MIKTTLIIITLCIASYAGLYAIDRHEINKCIEEGQTQAYCEARQVIINMENGG